MEFTFKFLQLFAITAYLISPLLISISAIIIGLGQWVGKLEGWKPFDAFYWSLITATTVGYGDFRPKHKLARLLSVCIAVLGVILTGILVSIAIESTTQTIYQLHRFDDFSEYYQKPKN